MKTINLGTSKGQSKKNEIEEADIAEKYPNEGTITNKKQNDLQENNYWLGRDVLECQRKWIKCTVLMEIINGALELPDTSTFEQLARRMFDLKQAADREENK